MWILAWTVGGECSEGSVGRPDGGVMVALMFIGSLGVVNPPRSMDTRLGL